MTQKARHRLHNAAPLALGNSLELDAAPSHYLANVLRLKPGDAVRLFNAENGEWQAELTELRKKSVTVHLIEQLRAPVPEPGPVLAFAPIKKARMDFLIEKSVELGVSALQPVVTARTQGQKLNYDRLEAQVIEAAEQSERLTVPEVRKSVTLPDFLRRSTGILLFADEARDGQTIASVAAEAAQLMSLLVGPEGGFAPEERAAILATDGAVGVTLGPRILRAETAALAALVELQVALERS